VLVGKTVGVGRQGWMFKDILDAPRKHGIEDRVIFTGFVPTEDLVYLLNGSLGFIQISLWEGFGIPVVEAMACGIPVIVSKVSSLPEVVEDAGLLVDPYSITQIEQAIRTIITDNKLRDKKGNLGVYQAKKFSWDRMAKITLKTLERVASE
jgi:glycosyltransferase involved in cell wall biosynthesis